MKRKTTTQEQLKQMTKQPLPPPLKMKPDPREHGQGDPQTPDQHRQKAEVSASSTQARNTGRNPGRWLPPNDALTHTIRLHKLGSSAQPPRPGLCN